MKLFFWGLLASIAISSGLYAQKNYTVFINQPDPVSINAGGDTLLCTGHSVQLGGSPTVTGGLGPYFYSWYPSDYLDNPSSPNPIALVDEATVFTLLVTDGRGCIYQDFVEVKTDLCTGLDELTGWKTWTFYPNPATDRIFIEGNFANPGEKISMRLLDCLGQVVQQEQFYGQSGRGYFEWILQNPSPGIYFLELSNGIIARVEKIQID